MRYLNDDEKVFQTEQECLDQDRKAMAAEIDKKRQELEKLTEEYHEKYVGSSKMEPLNKKPLNKEEILSVLFGL